MLHFMRDLTDISVEHFKYKLRTVGAVADSITISPHTNNVYNSFTEIFSSFYKECFPKSKIKLKNTIIPE